MKELGRRVRPDIVVPIATTTFGAILTFLATREGQQAEQARLLLLGAPVLVGGIIGLITMIKNPRRETAQMNSPRV